MSKRSVKAPIKGPNSGSPIDAVRMNHTIAETYELTRNGLTMTCEILGKADSVYFQAPLIETDGAHHSRVETGNRFLPESPPGTLDRVSLLRPGGVDTRLEEFTAPNRNGVYRVGVFSAKGNSITCRLSIE